MADAWSPMPAPAGWSKRNRCDDDVVSTTSDLFAATDTERRRFSCRRGELLEQRQRHAVTGVVERALAQYEQRRLRAGIARWRDPAP